MSSSATRSAGEPDLGRPRAGFLSTDHPVYAGYCEQISHRRAAAAGLAGLGDLPADEIDELVDRIDAQRAGRKLLERCAQLPALEREAVELVDVDGLTPKDAAAALGVPRGVLRMRLSRARARLRKEHRINE